jgi:hypothetical protein
MPVPVKLFHLYKIKRSLCSCNWKGSLEKTGMDGRMILKWILRHNMSGYGLDSCYSSSGLVEGRRKVLGETNPVQTLTNRRAKSPWFSGSEGSTVVLDTESHISCSYSGRLGVKQPYCFTVSQVSSVSANSDANFPLQSPGFETVRQFQLALCLYELNYILSRDWVTNKAGSGLNEQDYLLLIRTISNYT